MKNLKKLLSIVLVLAMALSILAGCGGDQPGSNTTDPTGGQTGRPKVHAVKYALFLMLLCVRQCRICHHHRGRLVGKYHIVLFLQAIDKNGGRDHVAVVVQHSKKNIISSADGEGSADPDTIVDLFPVLPIFILRVYVTHGIIGDVRNHMHAVSQTNQFLTDIRQRKRFRPVMLANNENFHISLQISRFQPLP